MQAPYIPAKDALFALWLANFSDLLTATPVAYGLVAGDAVIVAASNAAFQASYALAINPTTRTSANIAAKDSDRASATATVQPYAQTISKSSAVSDALKIGIGVNLPNPSRTPVPPPATTPALSLVSLTPGVLTFSYKDTSTPASKAKPFGAIAMEVRKSVGVDVAPDPNACPLYGMVTKSPNVVTFAPADAGKVATIYGRWITRSGPSGNAQPGPWSTALSFNVV